MADLSAPKKLYEQFQAAFHQNDFANAKRLLSAIKLELTKLPSLPPVSQPSANAAEQLALARDVLELAVLTAAKQTDDALFERNFAQLRPYYTDCRAALPPSPQEPLVVGLNLLRLLVQNRIAEFHTELELVPPSLLDTAEVAQVAELEQRLMEGAHNKVLAARGSPASPYYVPYLDRLYSTVRDEIASCSEKAYPLLSVKEAIKLLLMSNESELQAYATQRGWEVVGGQVKFQAGAGEDGGNSGKGVLQSMDLINHCLTYAKELERIV